MGLEDEAREGGKRLAESPTYSKHSANSSCYQCYLLQVIDVWDEGSRNSEEDMLLLQPWWRSRGGLLLGGVSQLPSEQPEGELAVRSQCGIPVILQTQERELWVQGLGS